MPELLVAVFTMSLSAWLTHRFSKPQSWFYLLDHPNERSLHSRSTPRTGGVAIVIAVLFAFALLALFTDSGTFLSWLVLSTLILAVLSYLDDRRGLSVSTRLVGHLIVAGILVSSGLVLPEVSLPGMAWEWPAWLSACFSLFFLVWMVNLYNFMDGMDGFAGGMGVIGFATFSLLGLMGGDMLFMHISLMIAAATGGFLAFNFPPARIFMGDTGSSVLGLLAGGMMLWAAERQTFPIWTGVLVFSPFLVDATITLVRRVLRRERVWLAHKTHFYQRLALSGWGHRKTVLAEYALMVACSLSALVAGSLSEKVQVGLLLLWCIVYTALAIGIELRLRKKEF